MKGFIFLLSTFYFLFSAVFAFAQSFSIPNPLQAQDIQGIIKTLINGLWILAIAIIPIMVGVSAFYFLTSAGDPKHIERAKQILLYTAIGTGVIAASWFIVQMLQTIFNVR